MKTRTEPIFPNDQVRLELQVNDSNNVAIDLDSFPTLTIVDSSGEVYLGPTTSGVYRTSLGLYGYDLTIPSDANLGTWYEIWQGTINSQTVYGEFSFEVSATDYTCVDGYATDGYIKLGDDPGFDYSQTAIFNINKMLKALRARLNSSGQTISTDKYGNKIAVTCDIFSVDVLVTFLADALTWFNAIPHTTMFTFDDTEFCKTYQHILVQAAALMAMASKALIEKGREFTITDNGISFSPPGVSDVLNSQYGTELGNWDSTIKLIKSSMKPSPLSCGTLTIGVSRNPLISSLRFRRARQIV